MLSIPEFKLKHNIIGDSCKLQITVRSYSDKVRKQLLSGIKRKALATAESFNAPEPIVNVSEGTPSLKNNKDLVERIAPVFKREIGEENVAITEPSMGGEDFSRYGIAGVPIFMFRLGSVEADRLAGYEKANRPPPSLHSPIYYPDPEPTLKTGMICSINAVLELLAKKK